MKKSTWAGILRVLCRSAYESWDCLEHLEKESLLQRCLLISAYKNKYLPNNMAGRFMSCI